MFLKKILLFIRLYKEFFLKAFAQENKNFKIVNVDYESNQLYILLRGIITPIVFTFEQFINDHDILGRFPSSQISFLGYNFGLHYHLKASIKINSFLKVNNFDSRYYSIHALDRQKQLIFLDDKGFSHKKFPMQIILDSKLITKFSPIQSFYIGMLAGIHTNNYMNKLKNSSQINKLRIVL